jgi:hypothetical protein
MYGERFDIPAPDNLVMVSWFTGGEVFRSGCCYHRGNGKVFYFRPGHESYPTYFDKNVQLVIANGVRWAAPNGFVRPTYGNHKAVSKNNSSAGDVPRPCAVVRFFINDKIKESPCPVPKSLSRAIYAMPCGVVTRGSIAITSMPPLTWPMAPRWWCGVVAGAGLGCGMRNGHRHPHLYHRQSYRCRFDYPARSRGLAGSRNLARQGVTAFRWLFGEGDGLPGITVDLYGTVAVLQSYGSGPASIVHHVVAALVAVNPDLVAVLGSKNRDDDPATPQRRAVLWGAVPDHELVVTEHAGLQFVVDPQVGQKTGLFLDHRENRQTLMHYVAGLSVLNCFAYTGAFSLYALKGGARKVVSADIGDGRR